MTFCRSLCCLMNRQTAGAPLLFSLALPLTSFISHLPLCEVVIPPSGLDRFTVTTLTSSFLFFLRFIFSVHLSVHLSPSPYLISHSYYSTLLPGSSRPSLSSASSFISPRLSVRWHSTRLHLHAGNKCNCNVLWVIWVWVRHAITSAKSVFTLSEIKGKKKRSYKSKVNKVKR